jgi:tetratricopeptide (TPR) repeat protein
LAREQGDDRAALAHARRSRELREALHGPDDSMVAIGLLAEGLALSRVGRDEDAFVALERARRIDAARPLPPMVRAIMDAYEGRAHLSAGRYARAIDQLERAIAQQEQLGIEPIDRADVRFHLAQALWAVGRQDEALTQLAMVDRDLAPLGARADHRRRPIHAWIDREAVGYTMSDPQALATPR